MLLASTDLAGPRRRAACEHRRPHTRRISRGQQKIYGEFTCTYTPNGELLTKTDSTTGEVIQQWLWSGQLRIAAELDGSGNLVAQHIYGDKANVPELILRGGKTYRVITDHLGSPVMVVNIEDATDVLFEARYDAWGNRTALIGDEDAVPFGFAGRLYDADTGLVRFGARDYDPVTGRWISKDPLRWTKGESNVYVHGGDDPVNWLDVDGGAKQSPECQACRECQLEALGPTIVCVSVCWGAGAWTCRYIMSLCTPVCAPCTFQRLGHQDPTQPMNPTSGSEGTSGSGPSGGGGGGAHG